MDLKRPGKCPHCPAEYSTAQELRVHLSNVGDHVVDRLRRVQAAAQALMSNVNDWPMHEQVDLDQATDGTFHALQDAVRWADVVDEPDRDCVTTADGGCVAVGCMHDVK